MPLFKTKQFLLAPFLLAASLQVWADPNVLESSTQATTSVQPTCSIVSATGISFGQYNSLSTNLTANKDAQSSITLRCTNGTTGARIHLNAGQASGSRCSTTPIRKLGTALFYDLYQDSERTVHWGCEEANSRALPDFVSSIDALTVNIYGRIPGGQFPNQGTYTDTVSISVVL